VNNAWKLLVDWVNGEERERWFSPAPAASPAPSRAKAPEKKAHWSVHDLSKPEKTRIFNLLYRICGIIVSVTLLVVLMLAVFYMPRYGDPSNPTNNELVQRYIEMGLQECGAVNLVSNMILSYRVFDTFGESSVLFLAATSVTILLSKDTRNTPEKLLRYMAREDEAEDIINDRLLKMVTRILLPVIILYAVCIMFNGHISPGGGFAGGSILGGGLILFAQEFGTTGVRKFFSEHLYHIVKVTALAVYGGLLLYYAFTGANGLANHIPLGVPGTILSSGIIFPINVMVGFEVACTIYAFYSLFHKGEI
jgi:multicomponent Na+:H+ antiporter subunit B